MAAHQFHQISERLNVSSSDEDEEETEGVVCVRRPRVEEITPHVRMQVHYSAVKSHKGAISVLSA